MVFITYRKSDWFIRKACMHVFKIMHCGSKALQNPANDVTTHSAQLAVIAIPSEFSIKSCLAKAERT